MFAHFVAKVNKKVIFFNHIKPKLFWGLPGPRGGGGAHCAPLHNIYIFRPIAMKFGTDVT